MRQPMLFALHLSLFLLGLGSFDQQAHSRETSALSRIQQARLYDLHLEEGEWRISEFRAPRIEKGEVYPELSRTLSFSSESEARQALQDLSKTQALRSITEIQSLRQKWSVAIQTQTLKATSDPKKGLWRAKESWSEEWEDKYAQWVAAEVPTTFFKDLNLLVDCADVVYALRFIFSRIHQLRFGVRLAGSGILFTHAAYDSRWSKLPTDEDWKKDQRFLKALNFLLENTYTKSLLDDSYPVKVTPEYITPGTHFLDFTTYVNAAHTWIVFKTPQSAPEERALIMACASQPRQTWVLMTTPFLDSATEMPQARGGFMRLRWINAQGTALVSAPKMPGYSLEQFSPEFISEQGSLGLSTQFRISSTPDIELLFHHHLDGILQSLQARSYLVLNAQFNCTGTRTTECAPGSQRYDDYSTPSRDRRLANHIAVARELMRRYGAPLQRIWANWTKITPVTVQGRNLRMSEIIEIWDQQKFSSDPRDSVLRRWGLE